MSTVATITKYSPEEIVVTTQSSKIFNIDIIEDNKNSFHSEVLEVDTSYLHDKVSESATANECFRNTIKWINDTINNDTIIEINHSVASILISTKDIQKILDDLKINISIE